jgi:hypothetical protein
MVSKWSSEDVVKFLDVYEESEGLWNVRHSDHNNKTKGDSAVLKLMDELLKGNVAVESVEVLREKINSIENVGKVNMEHQLDETITVFIDLQDQLNMFRANFCPSSGAQD